MFGIEMLLWFIFDDLISIVESFFEFKIFWLCNYFEGYSSLRMLRGKLYIFEILNCGQIDRFGWIKDVCTQLAGYI